MDASIIPVANVLKVLLNIEVDDKRADKTVTFCVTFSNVGNVEDITFVTALDVVLLSGIIDGINTF